MTVRNVSFLAIEPWDPGKPFDEVACLFGISRVVPTPAEFRFRSVWSASDDFHLLFEFMNGQKIEVAGESVRVELQQSAAVV